MGVRFCGREVRAEELALIGEVVRTCRGVSRTELAHTVCELLEWRRANGALKSRECWALLEALEAAGTLVLPARRATKPRGVRTAVPRTAEGEPEEALCAPLATLGPLVLERVSTPAQHRRFRELLGRYHYQGHAVPYGAQLRYLVHLSRPRPRLVACLQHTSAAWRLAARERWIGWDDDQRARALGHIVNHSRFLILPWVQVPNLASAVLARAARRVPGDWEETYALRPLLLETLVDPARFAGTCYRAASWVALGRSAGRGRGDRRHRRHGAAPKALYVYPLVADARARLCRAAGEGREAEGGALATAH